MRFNNYQLINNYQLNICVLSDSISSFKQRNVFEQYNNQSYIHKKPTFDILNPIIKSKCKCNCKCGKFNKKNKIDVKLNCKNCTKHHDFSMIMIDKKYR